MIDEKKIKKRGKLVNSLRQNSHKITDYSNIKKIFELINKTKDEFNIETDEIIRIITQKIQEKESLAIPVSLFKERKLGVLEVIVKFLKEEHGLKYHTIAKLLNRNQRTIWATYNAVTKKCPGKQTFPLSDLFIPISIFNERKLGALELLVEYLKQELNLKYNAIAELINRDQRTIWACYNKAQKKRGVMLK